MIKNSCLFQRPSGMLLNDLSHCICLCFCALIYNKNGISGENDGIYNFKKRIEKEMA